MLEALFVWLSDLRLLLMMDDYGDDDRPNEVSLGDYSISCACRDLRRLQSCLQ